MIVGQADGAVQLFHDNNEKLATKSDGVDITGELQCDSLDVDGAADITGNVTLHANLDLQDSDKILLGTGDDIEIYHDGSHGYITNDTGFLHVYTTDFEVKNAAGNEQMIHATQNGAVTLRYDNSTKFATTSTGVTVTGKVTATGFDLASLSALP